MVSIKCSVLYFPPRSLLSCRPVLSKVLRASWENQGNLVSIKWPGLSQVSIHENLKWPGLMIETIEHILYTVIKSDFQSQFFLCHKTKDVFRFFCSRISIYHLSYYFKLFWAIVIIWTKSFRLKKIGDYFLLNSIFIF